MGADPRLRWAGVRHCWSMPIKDTAGDVLGTVALYGPRPRRPLPEHLRCCRTARAWRGSRSSARAYERLIHDARHDGLTGLPNRAAIFESARRGDPATRSRRSVAVLFVDLDGLKTLNDTLGHDLADEMIREVGQRLQGRRAQRDFVGRFGGDEFIDGRRGDATPRAGRPSSGARLLDTIAQPLPGRLTGGDGQHRHHPDPQQRHRRARGDPPSRQPRCTRPSARAGPMRVLGGASASARAPADDRPRACGARRCAASYTSSFSRCSQLGSRRDHRPSRRCCDGTAPRSGRSRRPSSSRSPRTPARSSRSAHGCLRESCETVARIARRPGASSSSRSTCPRTRSRIRASPGRFGSRSPTPRFSPEQLTLEITETALIRGDEVIAHTLRELESHGIRIVLDDFGTGVSSLSWLKEHPVGALKIDRGFISGLADDVRDQAIVASLIGMSRALGCTVTAEGVETDEQLDALRALDCERVQGFLLARPLPAAALEALLVSDNVVAIRPPAATIGPADLRQTARTRHHLEQAPEPSHHPAVLRLPASR